MPHLRRDLLRQKAPSGSLLSELAEVMRELGNGENAMSVSPHQFLRRCEREFASHKQGGGHAGGEDTFCFLLNLMSAVDATARECTYSNVRGEGGIFHRHVGMEVVTEIIGTTERNPYYRASGEAEPAIQLSTIDFRGLETSLESYFGNKVIKGYTGAKKRDAVGRSYAKPIQVVKRRSLQNLSNTLVFGLNRMQYNPKTGQSTKCSRPFDFPVRLDMSKHCFESQSPDLRPKRCVSKKDDAKAATHCDGNKYHLVGIIVHSGGLRYNFGHYYSLIYDRDSGRWWKFNDEHVLEATGMNQRELEKFRGGRESANVLIYERDNPKELTAEKSVGRNSSVVDAFVDDASTPPAVTSTLPTKPGEIMMRVADEHAELEASKQETIFVGWKRMDPERAGDALQSEPQSLGEQGQHSIPAGARAESEEVENSVAVHREGKLDGLECREEDRQERDSLNLDEGRSRGNDNNRKEELTTTSCQLSIDARNDEFNKESTENSTKEGRESKLHREIARLKAEAKVLDDELHEIRAEIQRHSKELRAIKRTTYSNKRQSSVPLPVANKSARLRRCYPSPQARYVQCSEPAPWTLACMPSCGASWFHSLGATMNFFLLIALLNQLN